VVGRRNVAGFVYGAVLAVAVVTAVSSDHSARAAFVLGGVLITAIVFWLAHTYAVTLQNRLSRSGRSVWADARAAAMHEATLLEAAILPSVPLLLAALDVLQRDTGILLAQLVGLAELFVSGYAVARVLEQPQLKAIASGGFCLALGAVLILLKAALH
jgi:zona occludens toxin (predicted ATPase)